MLGFIVFLFFIIVLALVGYIYYSSGTTTVLAGVPVAAPSVVQTSTLAPVAAPVTPVASQVVLTQDMSLQQSTPLTYNGNTLLLKPTGELLLTDSSGNHLGDINSNKTTTTGGPFTLKVQSDGNLVIYKSDNKALWASNTNKKGNAPYQLVMTSDNLNLVDSKSTVLWSIHK
jgi:hypothetical protein